MAFTRLCIFSRSPVLGQVKTRLSVTLGAQSALDAHECLVADTLDRLANIPGIESQLWIAGEIENPTVQRWGADWSITLREQVGNCLGARMGHALETCLDEGVIGLVVGSDCPPIDAAYVSQAAVALESHDLVLGPAEDGGYGLVGLRVVAAELFEDVHWGGSRVFTQTVTRAEDLGLSWIALDKVWDVDNEVDWQRFLAFRD